jgi:hypothetical protein
MACTGADGHHTTIDVWNVGRDSGGAIFEYRDCRWLEIEGLVLPHFAFFYRMIVEREYFQTDNWE